MEHTSSQPPDDDVTIPKRARMAPEDEAGVVAAPNSQQVMDFKEISGGTTQIGTENNVNNTNNIESQNNVQQQNSFTCKSVNIVNQYHYHGPDNRARQEHVEQVPVAPEYSEQTRNTPQSAEGVIEGRESVTHETQNPVFGNPDQRTSDPKNPDLQKAISILDKDGRVILCAHPGESRETLTSELCNYYRQNGFSVYHLPCVSAWERVGQRENECVVFDSAFGDLHFDTKQYHKYFKRDMQNNNPQRTKLILCTFSSVLKKLQHYDGDRKQLLSTVKVVELPQPIIPFTPEPYVDLLVRMFREPTRGTEMASVISLVMMGQGRFLSNVGQSKPHLKRLGFKVLADADLHVYASALEGFLLAEHGKGFIDRAVYEAAGLALGTAGFQGVLLQVCDVRFLVERVRSSGVAHVNSFVLTLAPDHTELLMTRIIHDLEKGCVAPWVQHPCLHSPDFLQQLEKRCEKEGKLQSVQRVVDNENSLPLLYWSVWGPTPLLSQWCLSVWHKTQVQDTGTVVLKALVVVHLLKLAQQQDTSLPACFTQDHFAQLTQAQVGTLSLPLPSETHRYTDKLKGLCDVMKQALSGQQCYLKNASLPIPSEVFEIRWTGEVVNLQLPSQHVYLALRLLTDREVDEQDADGNTVLHLAADAGQVQVVSLALQAGAPVTTKNKSGLTPFQLAASHRTRLSPNSESDHKVWFDFNTACAAGDLQTVKRLLCSSLSVDDRSKKDWTMLHYAARCGQIHIATLLLDLNADVNAVDGMQQTALHLACEHRHLSMVKLLVTHHADVNALTSNKSSALHVACESGDKEMAAVLLEREADVSVRCHTGHTPLSLACFNSHWDLAALLVQHGADCNTPLEGGTDTMLHKACREGLTELADFLLNSKACVDTQTQGGLTALHLACHQGHTECARLLVENGADLNKQTDHGETALHLACRQGHTQCARLLVENGAHLNKQTDHGYAALHLACYGGHTDCVRLLVENGTDLNKQTDDGDTALLLASQEGHVDIVRRLCTHSADVGKKNKDSVTPLRAACFKGNVDIVQLLIRHNADVNLKMTMGRTLLHDAFEQGHLEAVRVLLMQDTIDVNVKDDNGKTPLYVACEKGHTEIVRLLLEHKDIDVNATRIDGLSPLYIACGKGMTEIAQLLIQHHADVNMPGKAGWTPLHFASLTGNYSVVELLLQDDADINKTGSNGFTALHWACFKGHSDIVKLLLQNNADHTIKDSLGSTALDNARYRGHQDIVAMLKKLRPPSKNNTVSPFLQIVPRAK